MQMCRFQASESSLCSVYMGRSDSGKAPSWDFTHTHTHTENLRLQTWWIIWEQTRLQLIQKLSAAVWQTNKTQLKIINSECSHRLHAEQRFSDPGGPPETAPLSPWATWMLKDRPGFNVFTDRNVSMIHFVPQISSSWKKTHLLTACIKSAPWGETTPNNCFKSNIRAWLIRAFLWPVFINQLILSFFNLIFLLCCEEVLCRFKWQNATKWCSSWIISQHKYRWFEHSCFFLKKHCLNKYRNICRK